MRQTLSSGSVAPTHPSPSNVRVLAPADESALERLRSAEQQRLAAAFDPYPAEPAPGGVPLPKYLAPPARRRRRRSQLPAAGALLAAALPITLLMTVGIRHAASAHPANHRAIPVVAAAALTDPADGPAGLRLLHPPFRDMHEWVLPYPGVFTSGFGMRWGRMHEGIDLAGPWGSPIRAATGGVIEYAGPMPGYGNLMVIRDWDGTETAYGHMSSFIVRSGHVHAGQEIARIGAEGDATGPHLHFEVRINGHQVDPVPFLAKRGITV